MNTNPMKTYILSILLVAVAAAPLKAAPDNPYLPGQQASQTTKYKMISGYKEPFNDDLQSHISKGWTPVGGVSVTTWNNDLFFAQLLSHPASQ
jgi:hypothetical protein